MKIRELGVGEGAAEDLTFPASAPSACENSENIPRVGGLGQHLCRWGNSWQIRREDKHDVI